MIGIPNMTHLLANRGKTIIADWTERQCDLKCVTIVPDRQRRGDVGPSALFREIHREPTREEILEKHGEHPEVISMKPFPRLADTVVGRLQNNTRNERIVRAPRSSRS